MDADRKGSCLLGQPGTKGHKILCLIRHGQGVHNPKLNPVDLMYLVGMMQRDAHLTDKGRRQARALRSLMQSLPFEVVLVSPLTRTIETASEIFGDSEVPKHLVSLMCERCMMPADEGTPASQLKAKHPQIESWDGFDDLAEEFWPRRSMWNGDAEVAERAADFKQWLLCRNETCIALVGHSAFFSAMTGKPKLRNCEAAWCELGPKGEVTNYRKMPLEPGLMDDKAAGGPLAQQEGSFARRLEAIGKEANQWLAEALKKARTD